MTSYVSFIMDMESCRKSYGSSNGGAIGCPNKYHRLCHLLIIWCFVVVSTTMAQNGRVRWRQHDAYSVATEFVNVSKSLDAAEATLKEYVADHPTHHEKRIDKYIKAAKSSLVKEQEKVDHMIRYNKQLQLSVRVLEQKVREQTALLRVHRVKWFKLRFKDRQRKELEINRTAVMMLLGDNVTKRMSANEVKAANDRALELFNRCKTGFSGVDEVMSQHTSSSSLPKKRKSKVVTTVDLSVSTTCTPQCKSCRLTNKKTENK